MAAKAKPSCGVVVSSDQVFSDSLVLGSIGETCFLDYLLSNVAKAFPDLPRIFAMAFRDHQRMTKEFAEHIEALGFEFFVTDRDYGSRLLRAAGQYGLAHVVDVDATCPLTCFEYAHGLLERHLASGADLTLAHNLPRTIVPCVVSAEALSRRKSMSQTSMCAYYGIEEKVAKNDDYASFMLANPAYFAATLAEWPLTWQGAALDSFSEQFTGLRLTDKDSLHTLRSLLYTINAATLTVDDIVDYVLIQQMRSFWDRSTELDTKYAVVDGSGMGSADGFEQAALGETNWFVLNDKTFLDGKSPAKLSILEVGCGHGRLLKHLAAAFKTVHGADGSPMRFMEARFRFRDTPNVRLTQTDGRSLRQYPDDFVDRSFAHGVFVHIHSRTVIINYIKEMARVTKKGGLIKFDIYHGKGYFGAAPWFYGYGARFSEDDIKAVFAEAGIELVKIDYEMHVQFARGVDKEQSGLPLKQMLVTGRVI